MNRMISWLAMVVVAALAIMIAISNRQPVELDFWPLPVTIQMPLYAAFLAAAFGGFIGGGIVAWFSAGGVRRRARFAKRRAANLEKDLTELQRKITDLEDTNPRSNR